jgi:type IV secretory pathway VirB3-like protein
MKFAKIIFWIAGIWGILVLTPLYFMFNLIGEKDPPPITHPAFYYGFAGAALAWQIAFLIIASNPVRFRPFMIVGVAEKFAYAAALITLYLQNRLHRSDLTFGVVDLLFGIFFILAFLKTEAAQNAW